jgi:glycosyltransferase involved in cell wall biosynthesis
MDNFSVLMSVYSGERPDWLSESIESIINQTRKTNDFVIVCDGPLTEELNEILEKYQESLTIIRLESNDGLGNALNEGLKHCKNNIVARMDSDDISVPDRFSKQISVMVDQNLDIIGSYVTEFEMTQDNIKNQRKVPLSNEEIISFSKKRNPFNHPTVVFRKDRVEAAGGYIACPYFEDYYLWIRMLENKCKCANLDESLVLMRSGKDFYKRRGGVAYSNAIWHFCSLALKNKYIGIKEIIVYFIPRSIVSLLPNGLRKLFYDLLLRN